MGRLQIDTTMAVPGDGRRYPTESVMRELARDYELFPVYVRIWRRYLVDWCRMPESCFAEFVADIGDDPAGIIFHEEAWYHVFNFLTDTNGFRIPCPTDRPRPLQLDYFNYHHLHRAIYRDVKFSDTSDDDTEWLHAKQRAIREFAKHGFSLRDLSKMSSPKPGG